MSEILPGVSTPTPASLSTEETETPNQLPSEKTSTKPPRSFWREILQTVLMTMAIYFAVTAVVAPVQVLNISMQPNLYAGQRLMLNKAVYFHFDVNPWLRILPWVQVEGEHTVWPLGGPQRGDVVVLNNPRSDDRLIKRVIGLPGEKLEIRNGTVYINDKALNEPYLKETPLGSYSAITIPPDTIFVMGDNRNNSSDSRSFGPVAINLLVGKAEFRFTPFGNGWGILYHPSYNP